jgi:hypothetical protein
MSGRISNDDDAYYVRVIYNGEALSLPCQICSGEDNLCTSLCFVEDFLSLLSFAKESLLDCQNSADQSEIHFNPYSQNCYADPNSAEKISSDVLLYISLFLLGIFTGALFTKYAAYKSRIRRFKDIEYNEISMVDVGSRDENN